MRADHVEVSWDADKSNWLVRIKSGEEAIRRHCKLPKDADEQSLRVAALKVVQDEGYELDVVEVVIRREPCATSRGQFFALGGFDAAKPNDRRGQKNAPA